MAETSPVSPTQPPSHEQPKGVSNPKTNTNRFKIHFPIKIHFPDLGAGLKAFRNAVKKREFSDDDTIHGLYNLCRHYAEGVKIFLQMVIGVILVITLLLYGYVFLQSVLQNPSKALTNPFNPLEIIAYGLFFSTGVDLAYMLFTPGPDEALEPVITGLAAAILLG